MEETFDPLERLLLELRDATELYRAGGFGGRGGAVAALLSTLEYLPYASGGKIPWELFIPLSALLQALTDLDAGSISPMLRPSPKEGRPKQGQTRELLRALAVGAAEKLRGTGLTQAQAEKEVAKRLAQMKVKKQRGPGGLVTARTIKNWREGIASDVARMSVAAVALDGILGMSFGEAPNLAPDRARKHILDTLARIVVDYRIAADTLEDQAVGQASPDS